MKFFYLVCLFFLLGIPARASYDVYVDKDNQTGVEDGTEASPFDTIGEGVEAAALNGGSARKIWIAEGEYEEQVDLSDDVELYGAGDDKTIVLGRSSASHYWTWTIRMGDNTKIKDLGVKYGKQGVLVSSGSDAEITDCRISKSKLNGVYVEKAKSKKEKFVLTDSKIYDSSKRGMYLRKKRVVIDGNEIYDNDEEGIDLKSGIKGTIKNNEIYDNGESGLEMEMRRMDLKLKKNKIYSNKTNGVAFQYRGRIAAGEVEMINNKITKNKKYGLRCGLPSGGRPSAYYFSNAINFSGDQIKDNKLNWQSEFCNF